MADDKLVEVLASRSELETVLGADAVKAVKAELRFAEAMAKHDLYLAELNEEVKRLQGTLETYVEEHKKSGPSYNIVHDQVRNLADALSSRTRYLVKAYPAIDYLHVPDKILSIPDADLDAAMKVIYEHPTNRRTNALEEEGVLSSLKIRYLLDC